MEKIINKRLKSFLESSNYFAPQQSGFRENRTTYDHLIMLENAICTAFQNKSHLIAVSLDIEKAFEMVWKDRIRDILLEAGVKGNMLEFIKIFFKNRLIQVKANGFISQIKALENGVPQGSVISVSLFLIEINDIV